MTTANESNLKPVQTKEEARKRGRNGGIKSGEVRKQKKAMREQMELLLSLPNKDAKTKKQLKAMGIDTSNIDNQMALILSMYKKAISGDVQAAAFIRDSMGEKVAEKVEIRKSVEEVANEIESYISNKEKESE